MKTIRIIKPFFTGIIVSQVIFTLYVYFSNVKLFKKLSWIADAGYLIVPNENILSGLKNIKPAFFGGLFFTLSAGTALTIITIVMVWAWKRFFNKSCYFLIFSMLIFTAWIVQININGFCPVITLAYIIIPLSVAIVSILVIPEKRNSLDKRKLITVLSFILPIFLMAGLWLTCMERNMFLDIRDHLLLSNRTGKKINNFYYKYTLYPAESFNTLSQKTLKTCNLSAVADDKNRKYKDRLERVLRNYDYLDVGRQKGVDLRITIKNNMLCFENGNSIILKTGHNKFFHNPRKILDDFSRKTDKHAFFRQFTFFSLLVGFPLGLYLVIFIFFESALNVFLNSAISAAITAVICTILGLTLFLPVFLGQKNVPDYQPKDQSAGQIIKSLSSAKRQVRISALKEIVGKEINLDDFYNYYNKRTAFSTTERYWLAKAMGRSKNEETIKCLIDFTSDAETIVVCQAFHSLGQRRYRGAVDLILKKMGESVDWYSQFYGYNALRELGWKQAKLN